MMKEYGSRSISASSDRSGVFNFFSNLSLARSVTEDIVPIALSVIGLKVKDGLEISRKVRELYPSLFGK